MNRILNLLQSITLVSVSKWLVPSFLGVALGWALLTALPDWVVTHQLTNQHKQLKAEHTAAAAQGEAAHTDYRIDSAALATRQRTLHSQDSLLAQSEREILSTRRPRLVLPDASSLPREGTN